MRQDRTGGLGLSPVAGDLRVSVAFYLACHLGGPKLVATQIRLCADGLSSEAAWSGIRQFENISRTTKKIMEDHKLPKSQKGNAQKQARHIRYCLTQAREYRDASRVVGLSTRPLLMYYCVMSLAMAEFMMKQSGDSSIDMVRSIHSHHGLERLFHGKIDHEMELAASAPLLGAKRAVKNGDGFGTFELWHRTARELPLGGKKKSIYENSTTTGFSTAFVGNNERLELIPSGGITLLDCYRSIPGMADFVMHRGIRPALARATINSAENYVKKTLSNALIIHPENQNILDDVYKKILIEPCGIHKMEFLEHASGMTIKWGYESGDYMYGMSLPVAIQIDSHQIYLMSEIDSLNEFGLMYVGLYILGMYSRYYPDRWISDVESSSELALSALEFLSVCENRLPVNALSEFSGMNHVKGSMFG